MAPTHFSFRKLRRKFRQGGIRTAFFDATETIYRRILYPYIFYILSETNRIRILDAKDLERRADCTVDLDLENHDSVYEFTLGNIFSYTGLVVTDDFEIITQSVGSTQFSEKFTIESLSHQDFTRSAITPLFLNLYTKKLSGKKISKNVCPLIPRYNNYYHWMIGTVPKIRYVGKYQEKTGKSVTFLLPKDPPSWIGQTLSLLGCPSDRFLVSQAPIYKPDRTVVPPHPFPGQEGDYKWIRRRIFENLDTRSSRKSNKRVYISRENAIGRRVVNEENLMDMLSNYGFEKYRLEDRMVSENIQLFSNADMIVAPHGAGLTDILFCNDCTVVELFGSRENNAYELLCQDLGLDYVSLKCESVSTDILADIDCIEQVLIDKSQNV